MAEETRASEFDEFWVSHKTWILIQALRETSLPYPWEGPRVETPRPAEDWSDADVEALVEAITGRAMPRPIRAEKQDIVSLQVREAVRAIGRWRAIHWDPAKHPRGAIPQNRGWFSPTRGAAAPSARGVNATYRPKVMQTALRMSRNKRTATVNPLSLPPPPPSATGANIGASAGSTFNSEGVETAGTGPEVTDSFRAKVQLALELLDPDIARWWKATSVGGQLRARDAGWTGKKQHSWIESEAPLVEVDKSYTAGQTAQAIIDQVNSGLFANSIGAYLQNRQDRKNWQPRGTAEVAG